jgi:hypothetical protein
VIAFPLPLFQWELIEAVDPLFSSPSPRLADGVPPDIPPIELVAVKRCGLMSIGFPNDELDDWDGSSKSQPAIPPNGAPVSVV